MIDRLKTAIILQNDQCREYLIQNLLTMEYQILTGGDGDWLFAIPSGDKAVPVLLCAHWDTVRQPTGKHADEPVVLFEEHNKIENANGILGADDRAGCQLILEVASTLTIKPFILFTNFEERGKRGMKSFIKSKAIHEYKEYIYLVVSVDRQGHNEAVYYTKYPSGKLEFLLDKSGYTIKKGQSYTDGTLIAEEINLEHINVSYGGYNLHSADEFILKDSYMWSFRRLMLLTQGVYAPFTTTSDSIEPSENIVDAELVEEEYSLPAPVCEICKKTERVAYYYSWADAWLCTHCRNRITMDRDTIAREDVERAKLVLKAEQTRSREANLKNTIEHPDFPACPKCGTNKHVAWNVINAGFVCNHCRNEWYKGTSTFDGIFWALSQNGEIKRLFKTDSNTITVISGVGSHVRLEWSGPPRKCPHVKVCAFCGTVEPVMHELELKFGSKYFKMHVCTTCSADLVDMCALADTDVPF